MYACIDESMGVFTPTLITENVPVNVHKAPVVFMSVKRCGSNNTKRKSPGVRSASCVLTSVIFTTLLRTSFRALSDTSFLHAQMGGAEGVRSREQYTLVTGIDGGMHMHAIPRGLAA